MVTVGCHENGKGIICLDEKNSSAACRKNSKTCGWAKYSDILYKFRSEEASNGSGIYIPSNAIGINTDNGHVSWLEPCNKPKT